MKNKSGIFLTLLLILIIIPLLLLTVRQLREATSTQASRQTTKPYSPTAVPTNILVPTNVQTKNLTQEQRLLEKLNNRAPLSEDDGRAKKQILTSLPNGQNSGIVYSSPTISIEYIQAEDIFQIEINTLSIDQAKNEAVDWFKKQGMSHNGICNYPIEFYLNSTLGKEDTHFNPLPDGC